MKNSNLASHKNLASAKTPPRKASGQAGERVRAEADRAFGGWED